MSAYKLDSGKFVPYVDYTSTGSIAMPASSSSHPESLANRMLARYTYTVITPKIEKHYGCRNKAEPDKSTNSQISE